MPETTPDSAIEDYEVLSYHSSDNELDDDDDRGGGQSQTPLFGNSWSDQPDSFEQRQALSSLDTPTSSSIATTTSWTFPSSIDNSAEFMASLNDGVEEDEASFDRGLPENSLRFDPLATAVPAVPAVSNSVPRIVFHKRPTEIMSDIKYIILSGVYRLSYQPWVYELHRQFPELQLIWVDTKLLKKSWITESRDKFPSRKQVSKRAIRMDFYSESSDHSHHSEQELDSRVLPGYKRIQSIAIHPLDAATTLESLDPVVSSEAPVELSADGKATAIRHLSSLKYIEMEHLAAVSRGSRVPMSRHKANKHNKRSSVGSAAAPTATLVPYHVVVAALVFILLVVANFSSGETAVYVKELVRNKIQYLYANFVPTQDPQPTNSLTVTQKFNFNRGLPSAHEISSLIVTSLEQLDDFLREVAIKVYGIVTNAGRYAEHQGAWVVKNVQDLWESQVSLHRVLEKVSG